MLKRSLIFFGIVMAGLLAYVLLRPGAEPKPVYREVHPLRTDVEAVVLATGTVQPENRLDIKASIPGRAEQVLVHEGDHVKAGQIVAWMSSTERATLLDAARSEGPEQLKYWESLYQPMPIMAPLEGTIIQRNIEPGQTFLNTDAIIVESNRLVVKAQVDETDIAQITLHQPTEIRLDAYPNNPIDARVDHIAYDARVVSNVTTYVVDVLPIKQPDYMRSGMTANVKFNIDKHRDVLTIPTDTVRTRDGGRTSVLVKDGDENAVERTVELGLSDGKKVEIIKGLSETETVLVLQAQAKGKDHSRSGANPFNPMGGGRAKTSSKGGAKTSAPPSEGN